MEFPIWVAFLLLIFIFLALDLGVFHKKDKTLDVKEALFWTGVWVSMAFLFNLLIYFIYEYDVLGISKGLSGKEASLKFFTGYILEKSLSIDNIFVLSMIFTYFKIEDKYQHKVLFWGILGALIMRGFMIGLGTYLMESFTWLNYVFGFFLIFTAVKMLLSSHHEINPNDNAIVRLVKRFFTVRVLPEGKFISQVNGMLIISPLLVVLLVVEATDLMFAFDSIPAIFAITTDPFLVFTSNIFAILGLRSLYFALAAIIHRFQFLKTSLVFVLVFIGFKMLISHQYHIPIVVSLGIILGMLSIGVLASLVIKTKKTLSPLKSININQISIQD